MENKREDRLQRLLHALKKADKIHLNEAAQLLDVSQMTVRRDLNGTASPLILLGGYIVIDPKNSPATHYFVSEQKMRQTVEKRHLGKQAAMLVNDDDLVFFDCGTTTPYIIENIPDERVFTAICYSFNTFLALQEKPNCEVIMCGGKYRASNSIFIPFGKSSSELNNTLPDKAFISAAGVSLEYGVSCFNFDELLMKHQALQCAREKILVVDSSKFGKVRPASIAPLSEFSTLVTDTAPDKSFVDYCQESHIGLIY
ncbi:DNA-binding transcriptional repressor DeoR [Rouxiella sp. S1S-2]|uniref:DNA-binding transcriptional repressor DeoR n=1 Tax=Rouxiella sp. S1S-2 TaxID=2653856 RepID=UPI0012658E61|nr:DNA-binding transcriptional repressor DeoR [Rouxiella sp. S1S-2]KAB7897639.1 DNA-binding transcriptional repressor DeoR [Rouxiella sp. S1S-2]